VWQVFSAFESRNQIISEAGKSKQGLEGCIDVTRVVNIPEAVFKICKVSFFARYFKKEKR
jgi:hypothetical protein